LLADLANEGKEPFLDVDPGFGGGLQERTIERLGQVLAFGLRDLSLGLEIALVPADDEGHLVGVFDAEDLLSECGDLVEGCSRCDGVDAEEALTRPHVLVAHGAVLLLPGGVEDIQKTRFVVDGDLFSVRVFDGRVVFVDEMVLNQLDREGRFTDSSSTDDNELVFSCHLKIIS